MVGFSLVDYEKRNKLFSSAAFFSGFRETPETSEMDRYDQYEIIDTEIFEICWKFVEIGWF